MIYFTLLEVGYPDPPKPRHSTPQSWMIYTICRTENYQFTEARLEVNAMESTDRDTARRALIKLDVRSVSGDPLESQFDETAYHKAHDYHSEVLHKTIDIWRLWIGGKVRIYFIFLTGKRIVILKISTKHKQKLKQGEKKELASLAEEVLETLQTFQFTDREIP